MNHNWSGAPCFHAAAVWRQSRVPCMRCAVQQTPPTHLPAGLGTSLPVGSIKRPEAGLPNNQTPNPIHMRTPRFVQHHCEQQVDHDSKVLSPGTTFSPSHSTRSGLTLLPEGPRGGSTKLDFGPKISGVREKSLPVSSVIYTFTIMDCAHRSSRGGWSASKRCFSLGFSQCREIVISCRPAPPLATMIPASSWNIISTTMPCYLNGQQIRLYWDATRRSANISAGPEAQFSDLMT